MIRKLLLISCLLGSFCWHNAVADKPESPVTLQRTKDLSKLPSYLVRNTAAEPLTVTLESSLEDTEGNIIRKESSQHKLAPGLLDAWPAFAADNQLTDNIALLRTHITLTAEGSNAPAHTETLSAIVGTPRPVARDGDYFIGMNVHLQRYTPQEQWALLRLMREAGVRSVRIEPGFRAPEVDGSFYMDPRYEQAQLGAEAFGMNSLFSLTFFNPDFHRSDAKTAMAHDWAKAVGEHYKGRVFDYQYGNETNSGWGAYGTAADMVPHNKAMALGNLAADPGARTSTLGIAEADVYYLREMLRLGVGPYMKAITVHPYCGVPEAGVAKMEGNRALLGEFGGNQEIWATEIGFHFDEGGSLNPSTQQLTLVNGYTRDQQADYLARLYLLSRAKGIERIYWYNMYGRNDKETFWLVDENMNTVPAYDTLKFVASYVNDAEPLGGTASTEPVQRQLFRRADGSVFLAAWAVRNGIPTDLHLPEGTYTVYDTNGQRIDIDPRQPVLLGERPFIIEGLPADTSSFEQLGILANTLDERPLSQPTNRWEILPGQSVQIPCVVYNSGDKPLHASPVVLEQMPGWAITLPQSFEVAPRQTVTRQITLTAPDNAVPGVEYRFAFAIDSTGPARSHAFDARIRLKGEFPYTEHMLSKSAPHYPVRTPVDEHKTGFGPSEVQARRASAALTPATIDGNLTPEKWAPEDFIPLDQKGHWRLRDIQFPSDLNARVRAALRWDEHYLYVAWLVQDDNLSTLDLASRDWRDADNVRVFLSAEADPKQRSRQISEQDVLVIMTPTQQFHSENPGVQVPSLGGFQRKGAEAGIKAASRVWQGGYLIEAAIPLELIGTTASSGQTMGINLMSDDSDDGFRQNVSLLALLNYDYWNSPTSLTQLKLVD